MHLVVCLRDRAEILLTATSPVTDNGTLNNDLVSQTRNAERRIMENGIEQ